MDDRPRLVEPGPVSRGTANVIIVHGFPWYTTEAQARDYMQQLHPSNVSPATTRFYTNPTNGRSRGICFVEYGPKHRGAGTATRTVKGAPAPPTSQQSSGDDVDHTVLMKDLIEENAYERHFLRAVLYHLTSQNWDRGGRLPDLPTDPPPLVGARGGVLEGYGDEGFTVRCGAMLWLANTVTPGGNASMQALRKRLREESEAAKEEARTA
ncbi:hypothetical protein ERJ75_001600500 [Trypanosoma vivax]|uniref:RRM domain-containing protein n=1 Tax=Trypanosoma vivax (strain Y486) TaxID=1055687 RepID=G0TSL7_TRYVY|nr:hypothetical protein TRVL_01222 [Trypanosoma vivax]KAH8605579.1 hypothetical protein ERJ75_001600500 [Trypanosoma vivax]CCC46944.1 conserved hypothetical protein [Trypanosoma vivax Y486]